MINQENGSNFSRRLNPRRAESCQDREASEFMDDGPKGVVGRGREADEAREKEAQPGTPLCHHIVGKVRPLLESTFSQERKSRAGRKRIDVSIMFKMLILQQ